MSNTNDGGPAFARPASTGNNYLTGETDAPVDSQSGMSLRDYFAGQALIANTIAALCVVEAIKDSPKAAEFSLNTDAKSLAKEAYVTADAMLAARKQVAE